MCTDELTTGSVLMSARERRFLAAQSHAFNLRQRRFAQLFPDYLGPVAKDLPNMSRPAAAPTKPQAAAQGGPAAPPPAAAPAPPALDSAREKTTSPAPVPNQQAPRTSSMRPILWTVGAALVGLFALKVIDKLAM